MKIVYCADVRLPSEKAYGRQIMKTCEALQEAGVEICLLLPGRKNSITADAFSYYGVKPTFSIVYLPGPTLFTWGPVGYWLQALFFSVSVSSALRRLRPTAVYSRDLLPALTAKLTGFLTVWEAHNSRGDWVENFIIKRLDAVVTISDGLRKVIVSKVPSVGDKIRVIPDAVDLELFNIVDPKDRCRKKIGIINDQKLVVYTGHLYGWKGVDTLAEAARSLPANYTVMVVGGTDHDINRFKDKYHDIPNLVVAGRKRHEEIPYYLKAADALILPNSALEAISANYTSPLKLFEYLASGTPIVASDLPSLREILTDDLAVLVKPDDAGALAWAIQALLGDKERYAKMAKSLTRAAQEYSWQKRAEKIIDLLKNL